MEGGLSSKSFHPIELSRALFESEFTATTLMHLGVLLLYIVVCHTIALRRMTKRVLR